MAKTNYDIIDSEGAPIKAWVRGVPLEEAAEKQLRNVASLPIVHGHVAAMPDVHWGLGATIGSVIPCKGAIIPAAVGVDIGCGVMAVQTGLAARQLPDSLRDLRSTIEASVPHGRTRHGGHGDRGAWGEVPTVAAEVWERFLRRRFENIVARHGKIGDSNNVNHLATLGTGNHFIELCLDEAERLWVMLHSGSRGVGNRIGTYFISKAKQEMGKLLGALPDKDLAYLNEGTQTFDDYVEAVGWAQDYARLNRELMMQRILAVLRERLCDFEMGEVAVNCHHNYVARERHFGAEVWVTRKGAVRAGRGELGVIPGSMGAKSYIVKGRGSRASLCSCAHGAGRVMSRGEAKRCFTVADHEQATRGVECRKDKDVLDETPGAYKDIDAVMAAQKDLVQVVHTLKQVLCVKG